MCKTSLLYCWRQQTAAPWETGEVGKGAPEVKAQRRAMQEQQQKQLGEPERPMDLKQGSGTAAGAAVATAVGTAAGIAVGTAVVHHTTKLFLGVQACQGRR